MDVYKDFIQRLRRKHFEEVYLFLCDVAVKLKEYVNLLKCVKFEDGSYHTLYGEVKRIISSFMYFFSFTVDEVIKKADKYSNVIEKDDLMCLMQQTISVHQSHHVEFKKDFLPVKSAVEKQIYEEIENEYDAYMKKVYELRAKLDKLDKQNKVEDFAKDHFDIAIRKTSEIFNFTHNYLAMMLADSMDQIRTSLEEILLRTSSNLRKVQEECESDVNALLNRMYDKNKEGLTVCRRGKHCSLEMAEVSHSIKILRDKIEFYTADVPLSRLQDEIVHWKGRISEFSAIADNLTKLKKEKDDVTKQEEVYNTLRCTELPGTKKECWLNMGENFAKRKEYLTDMIFQEAKSLITFFSVRGSDRICYKDKVGPFYVDEFYHQVYVFDYGLGVYHLNCEGDFKQEPDHELYFFNKDGRYIKQDGGNIYQCAPCTSQYKMTPEGLLNKTTKDCGHSENARETCRMHIKDPTHVVILPDIDPVDISGTLDSETVKYLWDSFGSILPDALHDVGIAKPRNPIHYLAHKLLYHKFNRTATELRKKKKEAEQYQANIYKDRKEKAEAESKAWNSKQVPRRKPEESDDAQDRAVFEAQVAQLTFINALDYYNV